MLNTDDILDRMKAALGVRTNKELSEQLGVSEKTSSNWKVRSSIPLEAMLAVSLKKGISIDWLVFGKEEHQREELAVDEKMLLSAYRQMSQEQKVATLTQFSGLNSQKNTGTTINQSAGYAGKQTIITK